MQNQERSTLRRFSSLFTLLVLLVGSPIGPTPPASAEPLKLRLVGLMHENLAVLNRIEEAVARDEHARIPDEATHLSANARELRRADLAALGLDPARDDQFDAYLIRQEALADTLADAARRGDSAAVLFGVERMLRDACIRCHSDFREPQALHPPRVLFMRNLLNSVQSMNRGVVMNDFALVAREARELGAIADVITWSQVIETMFEIAQESDRTAFRGYLDRLSAEAIRIESAAVERDAGLVSQAVHRMVSEGCIACHQRFRKKDITP